MLAALALCLSVQAASLTASSPELRLSYDAFKTLYDRGEVLVLDTRSEGSYRAGHIPGAEWLPLDAVEPRIPDLRKETRTVVAYCS